MDKIIVEKKDEVYLKIFTSESIASELREYFSFKIENFHFYKNKFKNWDGTKRLFNIRTNTIYIGILPYLKAFAKDRNYDLDIRFDDTSNELSLHEGLEYVKKLNTNKSSRDYQILGFIHAIRKKRLLLVSPTASGKSLIIYYILRYLHDQGLKGLVVVPTSALVEQMYGDFAEYSKNDKTWNIDDMAHRVYSGRDKSSHKKLIISTWQSIYDLPKEYFKDYDFIIGDEAHEFKAKSLVKIMESLTNAHYRIGTTGTLDGKYVHKLILEGLFGITKKLVKTKDLIDRKILSDFNIKALLLKHPKSFTRLVPKDYHKELEMLVDSDHRNKFIKNLAVSLKGNTLILYRFVERHGEILYDLIKKDLPDDRKCYFIHGNVSVDEREDIRKSLENETDSILIASFGTFSRGSNVRNLTNLIFASPLKSRVRNLQSIGRVLRKSDKKKASILFDIGDDLRKFPHDDENYTLKHFISRLELYITEGFDYKMYNIELKEKST